MPVQLPHLLLRDGHVYFRRRVPVDLRSRLGFREWKLALDLPHSDTSKIAARLLELRDQTDTMISSARRGEWVDGKLSCLSPLVAPSSLTITKAYGEYIERHRDGRETEAERSAIAQFTMFAGDVDLVSLRRSKIREWLNWLQTDWGLAPSSARRRLNTMTAVFNRMIDDHDLALSNPFARQQIRGAEHRTDQRLPFHRNHLAAIDQLVSLEKVDPHLGRILIMLRYTGARVMEIAGLEPGDIVLESETPHIRIRPNKLRGLKTKGSERRVPIVKVSLAVTRACLDSAEDEAVFPENCRSMTLVSNKLNHAIRRAGVPKSSRLTAYSFRHTFAEAMHAAEIPSRIRRSVLGHAAPTTSERYGANTVGLAEVRRFMERAISHLGEVDRSNYRKEEWLDTD